MNYMFGMVRVAIMVAILVGGTYMLSSRLGVIGIVLDTIIDLVGFLGVVGIVMGRDIIVEIIMEAGENPYVIIPISIIVSLAPIVGTIIGITDRRCA